MNPVYLHARLTTPEQLRELLPAGDRPGAVESLTLDFKALPWGKKAKQGREPAVEFACDVAAMLNADGGSLVVGIGEVPGGRAGGLSGLEGVNWRDTRQQLTSWLRDRLDPRDAELFVAVPVDPIEIDGVPVYVIEVAPCPFGPVAVLDGARGVLIPVRRGTETTFLTLSEAVRRMDTDGRSRYLELRALEEAERKRVRIDAGLFIKFHDEAELVPLVGSAGMPSATIEELSADSVEFGVSLKDVQSMLSDAIYAWARRRVAEWESRRERAPSREVREAKKNEFFHVLNAIFVNRHQQPRFFRIPLREVRSITSTRSDNGVAPPSLLLHVKIVLHLSPDDAHWVVST